MSDRDVSIKLGKSISFLAVMKKKNTVFYRYITFLGRGDRYKGYLAMKKSVQNTKNYLIDTFFTERVFLNSIFVELGIFKTYHSAYTSVETLLFSSQDSNFQTIKNLKKVEKYFKKLQGGDMEFTEQAENVGKKSHYFHSMRCSNKAMYRLLNIKGKGRADRGLQMYLDEIEELKRTTIKILYEKFNGVQYRFSCDLAKRGVYKNASTATAAINKNLYIEDINFHFNTARKFRRIVKPYIKEQK